MALRPEDLPSDPAALAEMVLAFEGENDDLRAEIVTLKSLIFGARSERAAIVCAEQIAFDLERTAGSQLPANDDKPDAPRPERRKAKRNIGALPAHLPRVERVIEPASTLCPCCTGQMHRIGEESSEALDRVPAWLRVLRTIRPKYACRSCEGPIVQAPAPARLVEGGMATTALIAHIAAAKYAWQSARSHRLDHTILGGHDIETAVAAWIADYNAERPHSSLKYQTPAAYAATFTATGDRLRNPDQLRRSPVAPPAPLGVQNPETLTAAG
ncbi:transposase [Bradyrhizobium diazoefficiens]